MYYVNKYVHRKSIESNFLMTITHRIAVVLWTFNTFCYT